MLWTSNHKRVYLKTYRAKFAVRGPQVGYDRRVTVIAKFARDECNYKFRLPYAVSNRTTRIKLNSPVILIFKEVDNFEDYSQLYLMFL
jgi:hypothetical protein